MRGLALALALALAACVSVSYEKRRDLSPLEPVIETSVLPGRQAEVQVQQAEGGRLALVGTLFDECRTRENGQTRVRTHYVKETQGVESHIAAIAGAATVGGLALAVAPELSDEPGIDADGEETASPRTWAYVVGALTVVGSVASLGYLVWALGAAPPPPRTRIDATSGEWDSVTCNPKPAADLVVTLEYPPGAGDYTRSVVLDRAGRWVGETPELAAAWAENLQRHDDVVVTVGRGGVGGEAGDAVEVADILGSQFSALPAAWREAHAERRFIWGLGLAARSVVRAEEALEAKRVEAAEDALGTANAALDAVRSDDPRLMDQVRALRDAIGRLEALLVRTVEAMEAEAQRTAKAAFDRQRRAWTKRERAALRQCDRHLEEVRRRQSELRRLRESGSDRLYEATRLYNEWLERQAQGAYGEARRDLRAIAAEMEAVEARRPAAATGLSEAREKLVRETRERCISEPLP